MAARSTRRIDLAGRVVLVTGGAHGLGFAIARAFLGQGARVALCARDGEQVQRAVRRLAQYGQVWGRACDVTHATEVQGFVTSVLTRYGRIDVLINNAAECFVGPAAELEAQDLDRALQSILGSIHQTTMAVLPHMRRRRFGRIVNLTSLAGRVPTPHQIAYTAGKHAATGYSGTLAAELRAEGIRVSIVAPPPIDDGAALHVRLNGRRAEEFRWFATALTSSWFATDAEHVAEVVAAAARYGDAERAVTPGSWLLQRGAALFPSLTQVLLGTVSRRMPRPGPPGRTSPMLSADEVLERVLPDEALERLVAANRRSESRYMP